MAELVLESDIEEIVQNVGDSVEVFSGKKVLLSGGYGFLGKYFSQSFDILNKHVFGQACDVIVVDNLVSGGRPQQQNANSQGFTFVERNIAEPFSWDQKIDFVIHLAGIPSPYYYNKYPLETMDASVSGTRNMLELAREHGATMLFFSSSEIYGDPDPNYIPTPESYRGNISCLGPRACYDEGKRLGETLCYIYHKHFGVDAKIVRPFNVYGPGMRKTDYRVLPTFAAAVVDDIPVRVYGSGQQTRTFCYVTDAMTGFFKVLTAGVPGSVYNIGNDKPEVSVLDLIEYIERVIARKLEFRLVGYPDSYPTDEPQRRCPDITKATLQLDFRPNVELPNGLARFFRWANEFYAEG